MMVVDDAEDMKIISQYFGYIVDYSYIADITREDMETFLENLALAKEKMLDIESNDCQAVAA